MDLKSKVIPATPSVHSMRDELTGVAFFVGAIWCVFFLDKLLPLTQWFALVPRNLMGLSGIVAMPFLHDGFGHLWSNTIPLIILLSLLAGSRARSWEIIIFICLIGGVLLWLFGSPGTFIKGLFSDATTINRHVGASLLVFGLITFLVSSGFLEKRPIPLAIALLVGFMYGLTFVWGIIPKLASNVSWEGHLFGGVAGVVVAYWLTRKKESFEAAANTLDIKGKFKAGA